MPARLVFSMAVFAAFMMLSLSHGGMSSIGVTRAWAQASASVEGFRSARFGMTEKQIYKALKKDFGLSKDDVTRTQNPIEKTTSLLLAVNDIIPDSGQAIVAYIFGYETKKLIQINIIWSGDGETLASAENLVATGNILRNYFVEQSFPTEGLMLNQRLTNGSVIVFRGIDSKGRATVLQLNIEQSQTGEDGPAVDGKITSLSLSYILNSTAPDIFRLNQGEF